MYVPRVILILQAIQAGIDSGFYLYQNLSCILYIIIIILEGTEVYFNVPTGNF